jgi:dimethylhistidine N-methyltransferase
VISLLPEYGLTRAGYRLLRRNADEIVSLLPAGVTVAELGSGSGRKTRLLLEAFSRRRPTTYHPIEISPRALALCRRELMDIESVSVVGFEKEYLDGLREVAVRREPGEHVLVLFLGSTIGNFDRPAGEEFLRQVRRILAPGDALLLATDLEQPVHELVLAYDDPLGVTAAFNLNLLARLNRELDADFDLARFSHRALWVESASRIEMHLVSEAEQVVHLDGLAIHFARGESICTEHSHKYTLEGFARLARRAGLGVRRVWTDRRARFSVQYLEVPRRQ